MSLPTLPPARVAQSCWDRGVLPFSSDPVSAKLQAHQNSISANFADLQVSVEQELGAQKRLFSERLLTLEDGKDHFVHGLAALDMRISKLDGNISTLAARHDALSAQSTVSAGSGRSASSSSLTHEYDSAGGTFKDGPTKQVDAALGARGTPWQGKALEERIGSIEMQLTQLGGFVQARIAQFETSLASRGFWRDVAGVEARFNEIVSRIQHIESDMKRPRVMPPLTPPPPPPDPDATAKPAQPAHAQQLVRIGAQLQEVEGRVLSVERCAEMWLVAMEMENVDHAQPQAPRAISRGSSSSRINSARDRVQVQARAVAETLFDEKISMEGPGSIRAMTEKVVMQKLAEWEQSRASPAGSPKGQAPAARPVQRCLAVLRRNGSS